MFAFLGFSEVKNALAQSSTCNVIYANIRTNVVVDNPNGDDDGDGETNFEEEFFIDGQGAYVYFDIKTVGCIDNNNDYDMEISLTEKDGIADDDVNGIAELDDWNIDVPSANFTIAYIAGEDECETNGDPDCEYHIEIWDYNSSAEEWSSLNYSCDVNCDEDWEFVSFLPYGENLPQDISDVTPSQTNPVDGTGISTDYLAPLPGLAGQPSTLQGFLQGLFNVLIVIAGILAIIMLVVGGITYLSSDALSKTENGREMMTNAVLGLILALGSWVIINTINPNLAESLKITIPKASIDGTSPEWAGGNAPTGTNICPGHTLGGNIITQGSFWPDDSAQRNTLGSANISVVSSTGSNCAGPNGAGTPGCTSVYFEGGAAGVIDKMLQLRQNCTGCQLVITGGSECWLHSTHGPTRNVVDLRATPTLNAFINQFHGNGSGGTSFPSGKKINVPGIGRFYAEPSGSTSNTTNAHWHVYEL